MKKIYSFFFFIMLLLNSVTSTAQNIDLPVHFKSGNFITGNNIQRLSFQKDNLLPSLFNNNYYVLVQFSVLPSEQIRKELKNTGLELGTYIPGNAYLTTIKKGFDFSLVNKYSIISINPVPLFYKTDPDLRFYQNENVKQDVKTFAVSFFTSVSKKEIELQLQKMGLVLVPTKFSFNNTVLIQPDVNKVSDIAALPYVSFITVQSLKDKILNYNDVALHGISSLQSLSGRNLIGKNVVVGVGDNADISTHIDFNGKLISRHPFSVDNHGTHTSGTTAGGGFLNPMYHGMAPRAHIVSQWFSDVILNTPTYVTDYNMVATNNSYYSSAAGCTGNRVYDVLSNYVDDQLRNYDEVLHVIAAGNDGGSTCPGYPASFGTVKSGWQCGKNVITVGSIVQSTYTIAGYSSRGPLQDGRIKPEIVTSGSGTTSTYPNNTYGAGSGTSMAAPVVTGAVALLQERYRQLNSGANAKAALIKALMCNTAEDLGNTGPDYTYGFGMLNARKAVEAMEANQYYTNSMVTSQNDPYNITVPSGARRLKILLTWTDYPAAANAAVALVNDLDLTVTEPSSLVRLPLILNPASVNSNAVEGVDHINNIEQIVIDNPVAGTYNVNVNGFAIPQGPQTYFLTYQVDMNGITVEYPFGGETLVPTQTETIRWTAYGNEANTFSVQYSDNNGGSWNPVGSGTAVATARSMSWTVPATVSNNYLVRVSRNATALTDQSDFTFTVLGQPVITPSTPVIPCEGYVQLNWPAITGATSYDILQLKGDSMDVIANTASNSYLVSGLNSTTEYWFSVSAKNGSVSGRRSLAVKTTPSAGTCSLAAFDGNFKAVSIDAPVTGRAFTSSALSATEQIKLTVKNLDNVTSSGSYDLSYQINGGTVFTENVSVIIASLGTYTHTFAATAAFASAGVYTIKAWVTKIGDALPQDDTVTTVVKNLANPLLVLPVTDGFESATNKEYATNTIGLDGDDRSDFKTSSTRGRARTFVNTGFALNGNRAITLDQSPYGALVTDSLLMTWNLNNYSSGNQLRVVFNYKNHGQAANPNNKVWIRGADNLPWIFAYDLVANQNDLGQWKQGLINVNEIMDTAAVPQAIGTSFQIKIAQQGITSANVPDPILDQDDGYTIDDVSVAEAIGDVAIIEIVSPLKDGCGLASNYPVSIKVKNYTNSTINNIQVNYRFNGGAVVTENITVLNPNQLLTYTFTATANLSTYIDYNFDFWLTAAGDNYQSNDSVLNYALHNSPVITAYPYLESFESGDGNWYAKGSNTSWVWGIPAKTNINKAANGNKAWVTGLTANYNDNELSYLYSPCFDLSGLTQPVLSFSHVYQIEQDYDYNWVEYSTDGRVWQKLGTVGSGTNWYDNAGVNNWRLSNTKWHVASIDIPPYAGNMRFRIVMSSDGGLNYEGVGIDDIHVFDKALIYTGTQVTGITQSVSGSNWIHFTSGGKRVASINPNGFNMGSTSVDVYPYSGAVRISSNQYYLNRNIVIRPTTQPGGYVTVRFYFTDAEAKSLIAATGCGGCSKPGDPYELGVTKYSGTALEENGTLADNVSGSYMFVLPANTDIIPYDNGYYAEFPINSFSEFWLNNGGVTGTQPLPINLVSFEAIKQNNKVLLQWTTTNEINANKYIVERSVDGINYSGIGTISANNSISTNHYSLTDVQPKAGLNFYRLKMIDKDASFRYSRVRKINFSNGDEILIYPNPVADGKIFIVSSANVTKAILYDAAGKTIKVFSLQGTNNSLNLIGIAKGIYQLKIYTGNSMHTEKIMIQ